MCLSIHVDKIYDFNVAIINCPHIGSDIPTATVNEVYISQFRRCVEWFCWCFSAIFSNISAISWRPALVVEEAGVPGENDPEQATGKLYHLRLRAECTFFVIYKAGHESTPYWWYVLVWTVRSNDVTHWAPGPSYATLELVVCIQTFYNFIVFWVLNLSQEFLNNHLILYFQRCFGRKQR